MTRNNDYDFYVENRSSDGGNKFMLNKSDDDLFDEEKNKPEKLIRIKRTATAAGEKWKIFEDAKPIFVIEASKISKKEKEYLRTVDGFNFLIAQFKAGIKSLNSLRAELKKKI